MRPSLVAAPLLIVVVACGGSIITKKKPSPPAATGIQAFISALRSDDPKPAYALLSAEIQRDVTFEQFALEWKQNKPERSFRAAALAEGLKGNPDLGERSKVVYADGKSVNLLRENGEWRLESALVSRFHAGRPHDAVKIFAEGLAGRDYDALMRILSSRRRKLISNKVDTFATTLIKHLNDEIAFLGNDKAVLRWEDDEHRYKLVLLKEGDEWRVDDFDMDAAPPKKKKQKKVTRPPSVPRYR